LEEKDFSETKKARNGAGLSASHSARRVSYLRQHSGWVRTARCRGSTGGVGVHHLPVLSLFYLRLSVLRIRWSVRHISLGYDARKLREEGVGRGGVSAVSVGRTDAKTECCGSSKKHGLHGIIASFAGRT
jgi:hypothetical protein